MNEREEWDRVVKTFSDYDVYWLSGYVRAFELNGDGQPLLFYYEDVKTRGINLVMKRDIHNVDKVSKCIDEETFFDFSTPYGYGGWIIEGDNYAELFKSYENWCINNNIVCEFVRFHPMLKNEKFVCDFYNVIHLGNTVFMRLDSSDVIWENIISKNRNMIRKAEKSGVQIFNGRSIELFRTFKQIYDQTMMNDNAEDYYFFDEEFYNSICFDLAENSQIFYAVKDGEAIAASIMLCANGKMNYHLSGSCFEYRTYAPSNLLLYKAALWGCENGCKTFHLGGGVGSQEDNLFKFKKSFYRKDDLSTFCIGKKIFNEEMYMELVNYSKTEDSKFFPQYRA